MTDGTKNNGDSSQPACPGFKRFSGAKLVPLPSPIAQSNDKERFPAFLGAGIALSMLALVTVIILSFTTAKKKALSRPSPSPTPLAGTLAHQ